MMSVAKFLELPCRSSQSFEDAIRQTVERASSAIRNIQCVWAEEFDAVVQNNQVTHSHPPALSVRLIGAKRRVMNRRKPC